MNIRLAFLFVFLLVSSLQTWAQKKPIDSTSVTTPDASAAEGALSSFIPKVVPPSPDAASLGRYGEIPVDLSHGLASVSIPLYEIQSGTLKVPISLNYHSGGVRVNDLAGSVGLSWSLAAGGALTRAVIGLPDENSFGFFNTTIPKESFTIGPEFDAFQCYIGKLAEYDGARFDGQQDSYFYNFNGNSGRFAYANWRNSINQALATRAAVTIPYKPIKIQNQTFTDVDGTIYTFGANVNGKGSTETTSYVGDISYNFTSTWYLSHMVSANRIDTVYFEYTTSVGISNPMLWTTTLIKKETENGVKSFSYSKSAGTSAINTVYPSSIYFKNGKVSFTYAADRQDLTGAKRLTGIYVYKKESTGSYTEIKRFELSHSYYTTSDGYTQADYQPTATHAGSALLKRLRLDSVTEKAPGGTALPAYTFNYYDAVSLPIYGSYAQDFWGFYNGAIGNTKLLLWDTDGALGEPSAANGANRMPSFTHAVTGSLKTIQYPTGGKTVFEYEAHQLTSGVGGGGIRIKSISNYEGTTLLTKKSFGYPGGYITNNISTGNMAGLAYQFTVAQEESDDQCATTHYRNYTSFPENYNFMLGSNSGSSMAYSSVDASLVNSSDVSIGKTTSTFTTSTDFTSSMFPFATVSNDWLRGQLLEENHYNSSGTLVKRTKNKYTTMFTDSLVRGYGSYATKRPLIGCGLHVSWCDDEDFAATTEHQWRYQALDQRVGSIFLDSTMAYTYNETGGSVLFEKKEFTYAKATHHQVIKQKATNSKNQTEETNYKYPHELAASNPGYQDMVNRHIYTPVIEQEGKVNNTFTSLLKTNYIKWYPSNSYGGVTGFFAPLSVELQQAGGTLIPQIVYGEKLASPTENGYDSQGHPVVYTTLDGTVTRLAWWQQKGKLDLVNVQQVNGLFSTTYDYHPLIGAKSITNPDGIALFYEYDGFGRLVKIHKDTETGPVTKSFCYNYAGQTVSCDLISGISGVTPASTFALLPDVTDPLPVTLIEFNAAKEEQLAMLTWKTSEETNSDHFLVERSADGKRWAKVGRVPAKGESNVVQDYFFRDSSPQLGQNLYRLKMVDHDGSFAYSRVQSVSFDDGIALYPNPLVAGEKLVLLGIPPQAIVKLEIFNQQGKLMHSGRLKTEQIDTASLSNGSYLVQITQTNGVITTLRFVKK